MMKVSSFYSLVFTLFIPFLFIRCANEPKYPIQPDKKPPPASDKFIFVKDSLGNIFFINGTQVLDITKTQVVGVDHTPPTQEPGINVQVQNSYNKFWDTYIELSRKKYEDVGKIKLAMEIGVEIMPGSHIGSEVILRGPDVLVTSYMFKKGFKRIIISDPRVKTAALFATYQKSWVLFTERGGLVSMTDDPKGGLPIVNITKEPVFTEKDIEWINKEWYPCYKMDLQFESNIWQECQKGNMAVIGAAHALRLQRNKKAKVALVVSEATLTATLFSLKFEDHYLKFVKK